MLGMKKTFIFVGGPLDGKEVKKSTVISNPPTFLGLDGETPFDYKIGCRIQKLAESGKPARSNAKHSSVYRISALPSRHAERLLNLPPSDHSMITYTFVSCEISRKIPRKLTELEKHPDIPGDVEKLYEKFGEREFTSKMAADALNRPAKVMSVNNLLSSAIHAKLTVTGKMGQMRESGKASIQYGIKTWKIRPTDAGTP